MPEQEPEKPGETKNELVKIAVDDLAKHCVTLEEENKLLKAENDALKETVSETTAFLDSQVRAKLGGDLRRISRFSVEDIEHMTTVDMQNMVNTLEHASTIKKPMVPGKLEQDAQDTRLTVGSLFAAPLRPKPEAS
jgi:hypothetical protein